LCDILDLPTACRLHDEGHPKALALRGGVEQMEDLGDVGVSHDSSLNLTSAWLMSAAILALTRLFTCPPSQPPQKPKQAQERMFTGKGIAVDGAGGTKHSQDEAERILEERADWAVSNIQ